MKEMLLKKIQNEPKFCCDGSSWLLWVRKGEAIPFPWETSPSVVHTCMGNYGDIRTTLEVSPAFSLF